MTSQIVIVAVLIVYWILVWFLPGFFDMSRRDSWVLCIGLGLLGTVVAVAAWWRLRQESSAQGTSDPDNDIDFLLDEANRKLRASTLKNGNSLGELPLLFITGPAQSAKTTIAVHNGLDAEHLAGLVFKNNRIAPTGTGNLWLANGTVLVETGPAVWNDSARWNDFARRFTPSSLFAIGAGAQGSRAAVFCISAEELTRGGSADALNQLGRQARDHLTQLARCLGVRLPVYVIVTKTNLLSGFPEFVSNFTEEEATQILGATLPTAVGGVYAETQTKRLTDALHGIFHSLTERRLQLLDLETDAAKRPAIYEFPREFSKLGSSLVPLLVEIGRPSSLHVAPFLRGVYFTGVRPLQTVDAADRARRVPQWIFIPQLFRDVLLADRAALGGSETSQKTRSIQRALLVAAALIAMVFICGWTTSFLFNRAAESRILEAARAIDASRGIPQGDCSLATVESLGNLDRLRVALGKLRQQKEHGAPMHMRWGLYPGDRLYLAARAAYFDRFDKLLLKNTQAALSGYLGSLPKRAGPNDNYGKPYNALKAYLITTSNAEKSERNFLAPVLEEHWQGACTVSDDRRRLSRLQFDFYSDELRLGNPLSIQNNRGNIDHAQAYLNDFTGVDRVYAAILGKAGKKASSIQFNRDYPETATTIVNRKEVSGSYTKDGFAVVQSSLKNLRKEFENEKWVLGESGGQGIDFTQLEQSLRQRYRDFYLKEWNDYIRQTVVVGYGSLQDAASKLQLLSGPRSTLLLCLYVASKNASVGDKAIEDALQPVRFVVDPGSPENKLVGQANTPYIEGLTALQDAISQLSKVPESMRASDPSAMAAMSAATSGRAAANKIATNFNGDTVGNLDQRVRKLLLDPIESAEPWIRSIDVGAFNGKGRQFCAEIRPLLVKYPFKPGSPEASLEEFNAVFQKPAGKLWQFYAANLSTLLREEGGTYLAIPAPTMSLTTQFVIWFNRMAAISKLYAGAYPQLSFKVLPSSNAEGGLKTSRLMIGGRGGALGAAGIQFTWPGDTNRGVEWTLGSDPTAETYPGLWGAFAWFEGAEWQLRGSNTYTVTWPLTIGNRPRQGPDGRPLKAYLDVDIPVPLFKKEYLKQVSSCPTATARPGN